MKKTVHPNALYEVAKNLKFEPHRISMDPTGRYNEPMDRNFPFFIRLFHFHHRDFTSAPSWHERLELFIPLDGPLRMRMGNRVAELGAGEILIVDNLKLHMVADTPAPDTRVIVVSFLPEFVCDGSTRSLDHVFLLPFYTRLAEEIHVVRNRTPFLPQMYEAMAKLLQCYAERNSYFQAGCKVYFLELLYYLAQHFRMANMRRSELVREQEHAATLQPVFEFVADHYAQPVTPNQAASMVNLRSPQFMKLFKKVAGMTFVSYVTLVRLSNAVPLLRETSLSIGEVAKQVGFADQSYFDRRFKTTFEQTPRIFRSKHNGNGQISLKSPEPV
jgi:AraC-like DNA-binding protein/mannose-6-phosphate isomerase-like protein (cupin superfamily)